MRDKIDALAAEFRLRLLTPDFDGFEAYFGCPVPPELRQFYGLKERLLAGVLSVTRETNDGPVRFALIQHAEPMDRANWTVRYGREYFRFATDTDGHGLLVRPASPGSAVFADWGVGRPTSDIEELDFTLAGVVATLGCDP